jgi:ATP-dependent DNA helicase RecG
MANVKCSNIRTQILKGGNKRMSIHIEQITNEQAEKIRLTPEGQFADVKAKEKAPKVLSEDISAFANADGGDLYIGITDMERKWIGFDKEEDANGFLQLFEELFPLGTYFHYEFLQCLTKQGLALHVNIIKTQNVIKASNGVPYLRRGAQSLPMNTPEKVKRLEMNKGVTSFESELLNIEKEVITESAITKKFIEDVVPTTTPEPWLKKQVLIKDERPSVAGVLLFAEEPQAVLQKNSGVKVYRYKTSEAEGFRNVLAGQPITIEGHLYKQIRETVKCTQEIIESIPKIGVGGFEKIKYPPESLHEIITNAVLHRDYSIKDDIHIRIFDNRVEVQSPGKLPAHITIDNILDERFARNGSIVRILNKFPDPPNRDVGEGLNTAFAKMAEFGLKAPVIQEMDNSVLVLIKHEPLASPEDTIMKYLETHETIKNAVARQITYIKTDFRMKRVFNGMEKAGLIEKVPGTRTASTAWRKRKQAPITIIKKPEVDFKQPSILDFHKS